jgi:hypothetical protein
MSTRSAGVNLAPFAGRPEPSYIYRVPLREAVVATAAAPAAPASVFPPLTPHSDRRADGTELVSYATLRRVVGLLGVALPIVVAIVGFVVHHQWWWFEPTISNYYEIDSARNAFVGILFTIAWFLFTYRGFDWRDRATGIFACIFALGVAVVPCTIPAIAKYHYLAAAGLFTSLTVFALLFRQSRGLMTPEKRTRNAIYLACAIVMMICIASLGVFGESLDGTLWAGIPAFYALETLALWAFGVSWFIKGETLFKDKR